MYVYLYLVRCWESKVLTEQERAHCGSSFERQRLHCRVMGISVKVHRYRGNI